MLPKIRKIYGLKHDPAFLPTPVIVPESIQKSATPKVVMMSRVDPRKRPELFLSLAEKFPEVDFHIAGKSRVPQYEKDLKEKYTSGNITFHGFVDQFKGTLHHDLMEQSWILANPAIREGLPNSYLEAAAHQTAILSYVDPDNFASAYGFHAAKDNFEEGLRTLLKNDLWKSQAMKGYNYVKETFALNKAMDQHEEVYDRVYSRKGKK
jgi:glycosyltransferase involved in cell wall biosynthesis